MQALRGVIQVVTRGGATHTLAGLHGDGGVVLRCASGERWAVGTPFDGAWTALTSWGRIEVDSEGRARYRPGEIRLGSRLRYTPDHPDWLGGYFVTTPVVAIARLNPREVAALNPSPPR